jgi:hypothetical protein
MNTLTLEELTEIEDLVKELDYAKQPDEMAHALSRLEHRLRLRCASLLSLARRQLEQQEAQGSPEGIRPPTSACAPPADSDVLPFKVERYGNVEFEDRFGDKMFLKRRPETQTMEILILSDEGISLKEKNVRSLIAHLQSWLDTGSFELKPQTVEGGSPQAVKIPIQLTHPTIHGDYYEWLNFVKSDDFSRRFMEEHSKDFKSFNAIAMWAWSRSREIAAKALSTTATDQSSDGKGGVA